MTRALLEVALLSLLGGTTARLGLLLVLLADEPPRLPCARALR